MQVTGIGVCVCMACLCFEAGIVNLLFFVCCFILQNHSNHYNNHAIPRSTQNGIPGTTINETCGPSVER